LNDRKTAHAFSTATFQKHSECTLQRKVELLIAGALERKVYTGNFTGDVCSIAFCAGSLRSLWGLFVGQRGRSPPGTCVVQFPTYAVQPSGLSARRRFRPRRIGGQKKLMLSAFVQTTFWKTREKALDRMFPSSNKIGGSCRELSSETLESIPTGSRNTNRNSPLASFIIKRSRFSGNFPPGSASRNNRSSRPAGLDAFK